MKIDDWAKMVEQKEGLPAIYIVEKLYQAICEGGLTFRELAKQLKKAMERK